MKKTITKFSITIAACALMMFTVPPNVSAQFYDAFTDSNYTINPTWSGDTAHFKVNTSFQLQTKDTLAGKSYLATPTALSTLDNMQWSFYIHLGFSPSANNNARVYLTSDSPNLKNGLHGYYLQFGEALSMDAVELFRQDDTVLTSICRGNNAEIANAFYLGVKVTRDPAGLWQLLVDTAGGTSYVLETSATDLTYNSSAWFGVVCTYTISNATSFFYDDFNVSSSICNLTATSDQINIHCNGESNGAAAIIVNGGLAPYSYLWSPTGQTTDTIILLQAGTYIGIATDINQCSDTVTLVITEPPPLSATANASDVLCNGDNTGTATVIAQGGTPPYSYLWFPAGGTSNVATNLVAGNYTVAITDFNGCMTSANFTINEPAPLVITDSVVSASCSFCCDGMAAVNATGGTFPYTFLWSNGSTALSIDSLCPDTSFTVTVTDANGCSITDTVDVPFNVGVNELLTENNFQITPNPANDFLTVSSKSLIKVMTIYNVLGEREDVTAVNCPPSRISPSADRLWTVDCRLFPNGIYFVHVQTENGTAVRKFIKQ